LKNTLWGRCTFAPNVAHPRTTAYIWLAPAVARPIFCSATLRKTSDIRERYDWITPLRYVYSIIMWRGYLRRSVSSLRSATWLNITADIQHVLHKTSFGFCSVHVGSSAPHYTQFKKILP